TPAKMCGATIKEVCPHLIAIYAAKHHQYAVSLKREYMPYDEDLAHRTRQLLSHRLDLVERKMFGGLAFMLAGNMACGIAGEALIVRVGPDAYQRALESPFAGEFDFTGRPLRGLVLVDPEGVETDE